MSTGDYDGAIMQKLNTLMYDRMRAGANFQEGAKGRLWRAAEYAFHPHLRTARGEEDFERLLDMEASLKPAPDPTSPWFKAS